VCLHVWGPEKKRSIIAKSLLPETKDAFFEKRASTKVEFTSNGLQVCVNAEDEQALNASLHSAIKSVSFIQKIIA